MGQIATITYQVSYTDDLGNACHPAPIMVACPYTVSARGSVVIPASTPIGTEFDLLLPSFAAGASLVVMVNNAGQELGCAWGGNFAPDFPAGGSLVMAFPSMPQARPVLGYRFFTTAIVPTAGKVAYRVFGDG